MDSTQIDQGFCSNCAQPALFNETSQKTRNSVSNWITGSITNHNMTFQIQSRSLEVWPLSQIRITIGIIISKHLVRVSWYFFGELK